MLFCFCDKTDEDNVGKLINNSTVLFSKGLQNVDENLVQIKLLSFKTRFTLDMNILHSLFIYWNIA